MKLIYLLVFLSICRNTVSERTSDKMYISVAGANCYRRLNATHSTGCSSSFSGSVGVLHYVANQNDIEFLIKNPPSPPYAAIIGPELFTRENILKLKNASDFISGIILINNSTSMKHFSQESKCPNQFSSFLGAKSNQCDVNKPETTWNPDGTGLILEDFPFPIFFLTNEEEIAKLIDCFEKFNNFDFPGHADRSLCSIQINAFMQAAVNSEVCIRRSNSMVNLSPSRFCDPLQGKNVYSTLFPRDIIKTSERKVIPSEKVILLTARMDTTSMFDGLGLGAKDTLVSMATLVGVAHFLAKVLPERVESSSPNVVFILFNGESYDYIGSQRFVYDVNREFFPSISTSTNPISLDNIELMIDLGTLDDPNSIQMYQAREFMKANQILNLLTKYNNLHSLNVSNEKIVTENLPPVSAQSFLKENVNFPVVIITSKPNNKFYHSVFDEASNLNYTYENTSIDFSQLDKLSEINKYFANNSIQMKIRNVSTLIAMSIYELVTNKIYDGENGASAALIDEFLNCFLITSNCTLFRTVSHTYNLPNLKNPPLRYISVHNSYTHESTSWLYRILGYVSSQIALDFTNKNCTYLPYQWYAGINDVGECRLVTQNFTQASSPAFLEENYDWKSGKYSTWTESTWRELSARIFLRPAKSHEALTLSIGFIVLIISFVLVFLVNSKSDILFGDTTSSIPIAQPTQC